MSNTRRAARGSDLEQIQKILDQAGADDQQRKTITDASWMQAQKILSEWSVF